MDWIAHHHPNGWKTGLIDTASPSSYTESNKEWLIGGYEMKTSPPSSRTQLLIGLVLLLLLVLSILAVPMAARLFLKLLDRSGEYHNHAVTVDIDADGDQDVLETGARNESESVMFAHSMLWLNDGAGNFSPFTGHALAEFYYPTGTVGDVDADGDLDLIMLAANTITVMPNRAPAPVGAELEDAQRDLLFDRKYNVHAPEEVAEAPGSHSTLISADFNLDGRADALVAGCCGSIFGMDDQDPVYFAPHSWVWYSANRQPDGPASGETLELKALHNLPVRQAAVGDFNSDGAPDVFAAVLHTEWQTQQPGNRVLINDRLGNLIDSGQRLGTDSYTSVALGDLDGDGDIDAVTGTGTGGQVWFNTRGRFFPGVDSLPAGPTLAVFVVDDDHKNGLDVLLIGEKRATYWLNNGKGRFNLAGEAVGFGKPDALAVVQLEEPRWHLPYTTILAFDASDHEYKHLHFVDPQKRWLWRFILDY